MRGIPPGLSSLLRQRTSTVTPEYNQHSLYLVTILRNSLPINTGPTKVSGRHPSFSRPINKPHSIYLGTPNAQYPYTAPEIAFNASCIKGDT